MDIINKAKEWLSADKDHREWHMESADVIISNLVAELQIKARFFSATEMEECRLMSRKRAAQESYSICINRHAYNLAKEIKERFELEI